MTRDKSFAFLLYCGLTLSAALMGFVKYWPQENREKTTRSSVGAGSIRVIAQSLRTKWFAINSEHISHYVLNCIVVAQSVLFLSQS